MKKMLDSYLCKFHFKPIKPVGGVLKKKNLIKNTQNVFLSLSLFNPELNTAESRTGTLNII